MTRDGIPTLEALVQIATPYERHAYTREVFLQYITPELEEKFSELYTEEFGDAIEEKGVYFIVNYQKPSIFPRSRTIRIGLCGQEGLPTISLDLEPLRGPWI